MLPEEVDRKTMDRNGPERSARVARWIGLALHFSVAAFPIAWTGAFAPWWAVALLWAVWVGLLVVALHPRTRQPWSILAAPAAPAGWYLIFHLSGWLAWSSG